MGFSPPNFQLAMPLHSRLTLDRRMDRQTTNGHHSHQRSSMFIGVGHNKSAKVIYHYNHKDLGLKVNDATNLIQVVTGTQNLMPSYTQCVPTAQPNLHIHIDRYILNGKKPYYSIKNIYLFIDLLVMIRLELCIACLIAPVVTTTSIILSSNKIENGDIMVLPHPGCSGKWPLNKCHHHC